ncbi:MAG: hypothetical protein HC915_00205 [Anaerolineae bacterium]|nr:hypothetical protein [Anaerolineae bacterium]
MHLAAAIADTAQRLLMPALAGTNEAIGIGRVMLVLAANRSAFPVEVRAAHSRAYRRAARSASLYVPYTIRWLRDHPPNR